MDDALSKEEETCKQNMKTIASYEHECQRLVEEYKEFQSSSEERKNVEKRLEIEQIIKNYQNKMNGLKLNLNELYIDLNDISLKECSIQSMDKKFRHLGLGRKGGILSVCGLENKIFNNGQTFDTNDDCLARTDDSMASNSGIYKILWKIEKLEIINQYNCVGICTRDYKQGTDICTKKWPNSLYYIGWCGKKDDTNSPNRLVSGWSNQEKNIFYKECKFHGDVLPQFGENDVVGLIYDSDNYTLSFELNGVLLKSKLINIPKQLKLCWFAAKCCFPVRFSIINN